MIANAPDLDALVRQAESLGYLDAKVSDDGKQVIAILRLIHTTAVVTITGEFGYEDRWCFYNYFGALRALTKWDGREGTEPEGWHRHPRSGRRRPGGNEALEYVNP